MRRPLRLLLATGLLLPALVACGDDGGSSGDDGAETALQGFEAVSVSGEPGSEPTIEWEGEMVAEELEVQVVSEGDGPEIASGDFVIAEIVLGNGFTQETVYSTYDEGRTPEVVQASDQLTPALVAALEGQTVGSRVAVVAPPEEAFGEQGNPALGIGNADSVLFVVDLVSPVLDGPRGEERDAPAGAPEVVEQDGAVTGLDFAAGARPTGELEVTTLVEGDGPAVEGPEAFVAVDYLGQVFGGDEPFDESYSSGQPVGFSLGGVVEGWTRGLDGVTVGSRVLLEIPSELGYGEQGQPSAGIEGGDTLVFVIDVLGTA